MTPEGNGPITDAVTDSQNSAVRGSATIFQVRGSRARSPHGPRRRRTNAQWARCRTNGRSAPIWADCSKPSTTLTIWIGRSLLGLRRQAIRLVPLRQSGTERCAEPAACGAMQGAKKRLARRIAVPALGHGGATTAGQDKARYIDSVCKAMLRHAVRAGDRPAAVRTKTLYFYDLGAQKFACGGPLRILRPTCEITHERTGHRPRIGDRRADVEQLDRVFRRATVARLLVWQRECVPVAVSAAKHRLASALLKVGAPTDDGLALRRC